MSLKILISTSLFIGFFAASPHALAKDEDTQVWASTTLIKQLDPKWTAQMELHARFFDDVSGLGQRMIRPSVTYKLDNGLTLTGGYFHGLNNPVNGSSTIEHRLWEQVGYTFLHTDDVKLSGRTRLEQRVVESRNDTGWRLRQQLRAEGPIAKDKVDWLVWNETFVGLNETEWGQRAAFDQTRNFVGLNVPVTKHIAIEPGYLNQYVFRSDEDQMNHVGSVTVNVKF